MKKIKAVLPIALLLVAPALYAQHTDTKAQPDFPNFKVTLDIKKNVGGSDVLKIQKQTSSLADGSAIDSIVPVATRNLKVIQGTKAQIALTANAGNMLESFTVNGTAKTITSSGSTSGNVNGSFTTVNAYTFETGALEGNANIAYSWKAKPAIKVTASNTQQTVNATNGATAIMYTAVVEGTTETVVLTPVYVTADGKTTTVGDIKTAGTYYVRFTTAEAFGYKALKDSVKLIINEKKTPGIAEDGGTLTSTAELLQGQPLSAALLDASKVVMKVGENTIYGTWNWAEPNKTLAAGDNTCKAVFTPDQAALYNTLTQDVAVKAKDVSTATVKQTPGGFVRIKDATADNKYVGTTSAKASITAIATPDAGYKFVSWSGVTAATVNQQKAGDTDNEAPVTSASTALTSDNTIVSAVFAKATRAVTIEATGDGTVTVTDDQGKEVKTNDQVAVGTTLSIKTTPAAGMQVQRAGYTFTATPGKADEELKQFSSFVIGLTPGAYAVKATFEAIPANKSLISVPILNNGTLLIKVGDAVIPANSSVEEGNTLSIIALPNKGYKLSTLTANTTDIKATSTYLVKKEDGDEVQLNATFEKETYPVIVNNTANVTLSIQAGNQAFGTLLSNITATVTDLKNYKLIGLLINNKQMENGSSVTVDGPVTLSAQVQKLAPLSILNTEEAQKITYTGDKLEYVVKAPTGLGNFQVSYFSDRACTTPATPINVGDYYVRITREAAAIYAAVEQVRVLSIEKAKPGITTIPFSDKITEEEVKGSTTVPGTWSVVSLRSAETKGLKDATVVPVITTLRFTPDDPNIAPIEVQTVQQEAAESKKTITMPSNVDNGTISLMNGEVPVPDLTTVYAGQIFSLNVTPAKGYILNPAAKIKVGGKEYKLGTTFTLTAEGTDLKSEATGITVENSLFIAKTKAGVTATSIAVSKDYTGDVIRLTTADLAAAGLTAGLDWEIYHKKSDVLVTPKEAAADYKIYVKCDGNETYDACLETAVGTLTIKKLSGTNGTIVVTPPTAQGVVTGNTLSNSLLTGGSITVNGLTVPGQFAWKDATTTVGKAGEYEVSFTSGSENFDLGTPSIKSYVALLDATSYNVTIKTAGGNGSVLVEGSQCVTIEQGKAVRIPAGTQLKITPVTGTIESVSGLESTVVTDANGKELYRTCVTGSADVTLTISFKTDGGSNPGVPDEGTPVTGIALNKSTLTLPRLASEKLVATVAPTGATRKDVKWMSTNPAVATVESDGTVKAITIGRATIIATTADGGFTAMCEVFVDYATSLEEALANTTVRAKNGMIYINPIQPLRATVVNMAGKPVYDARISGEIQVSVVAGVYIVKLTNADKTVTTKISVY